MNINIQISVTNAKQDTTSKIYNAIIDLLVEEELTIDDYRLTSTQNGVTHSIGTHPKIKCIHKP